MAKLTILLTILPILITTAAVAQDTPWFPLDDGWTNGYLPQGATGDPVEFDIVDGTATFQGAAVRVVRRGYAFETNIYELAYYSVDSDGSLLLHGRRYGVTGGSQYDEVYAPPLPLLPGDPTPGSSWSHSCAMSYYRDGVLSASRQREMSGQVVGLDPALTVAAGTYAGLEVIVTRDDGESLHNWYAEGTGLVRGNGILFSGDPYDLAADANVPVEDASWGGLKASFR